MPFLPKESSSSSNYQARKCAVPSPFPALGGERTSPSLRYSKSNSFFSQESNAHDMKHKQASFSESSVFPFEYGSSKFNRHGNVSSKMNDFPTRFEKGGFRGTQGSNYFPTTIEDSFKSNSNQINCVRNVAVSEEKHHKRFHHKTRGRIGFNEFPLEVADSWKGQLCAELYHVGSIQYHDALLAHKAAVYDRENGFIKTFELADPAVYDMSPPEAMFVPTDHCSLDQVDAAFESDLNLSMESLSDSMSDFTASSIRTRRSVRNSFNESLIDYMVDIDDDTIMDMYKSASIEATQEDDTSSFSTVSAFSNSPNDAPPSFDEHSQSSPNSTLTNIKTIRKAILNQQVQMRSSIIAARRLTQRIEKQGQYHRMNTFTARSA